MAAWLVPVDGGRPIRVEKTLTVVGRKPYVCDVYLADRTVSELHCVIACVGQTVHVRDLDSTNGTMVNGRLVTETDLFHGDELYLGQLRFQVLIEVSAPAAGYPGLMPMPRDDGEWVRLRKAGVGGIAHDPRAQRYAHADSIHSANASDEMTCFIASDAPRRSSKQGHQSSNRIAAALSSSDVKPVSH